MASALRQMPGPLVPVQPSDPPTLTPIAAPGLGDLNDVNVEAGSSVPYIHLDLSSATTLTSRLTVQVTSSNSVLLPAAVASEFYEH